MFLKVKTENDERETHNTSFKKNSQKNEKKMLFI